MVKGKSVSVFITECSHKLEFDSADHAVLHEVNCNGFIECDYISSGDPFSNDTIHRHKYMPEIEKCNERYHSYQDGLKALHTIYCSKGHRMDEVSITTYKSPKIKYFIALQCAGGCDRITIDMRYMHIFSNDWLMAQNTVSD